MDMLTESGGLCQLEDARDDASTSLTTPPQPALGNPAPSPRPKYSVAQVKDSMWGALDNIVQSGKTDQMRGYANEAMGKTKLTLGLATQSTHLTFTGLAQIVVGEFQKSIGEAKQSEEGNDILPGL